MHVAITGSRGLIGGALVELLAQDNHKVTPIVRGTAADGQLSWDPSADSFDASGLADVDAVVHLAAKNIAETRWTATVKQRIRESRTHATRVLSEGLARMASPPKVLVSASAIGIYGSRGDEVLTEESSAGSGFLAELACEWEAATQPAASAGIRVVHARFGVVLSHKGGALKKMLTPFKLGGGGLVGNGRQYWSWIALPDAAEAVRHALLCESLSGPVNVVAPHPVTNAEFTKTLGRLLSRPTFARMPAFAARLLLGEMADELLLASTRVEPQRLLNAGFEFHHVDLADALQSALHPAQPAHASGNQH